MSRPKFCLESLERRTVLASDLAALMSTAAVDTSADPSANQMEVSSHVGADGSAYVVCMAPGTDNGISAAVNVDANVDANVHTDSGIAADLGLVANVDTDVNSGLLGMNLLNLNANVDANIDPNVDANLGDLTGSINNVVGDASNLLNQTAGNVSDAVDNAVGNVSGALDDLTTNLDHTLSDTTDNVSGTVNNLTDGVQSAVDDVVSDVRDTTGELTDDVTNTVGDVTDNQTIPEILNGVTSDTNVNDLVGQLVGTAHLENLADRLNLDNIIPDDLTVGDLGNHLNLNGLTNSAGQNLSGFIHSLSNQVGHALDNLPVSTSSLPVATNNSSPLSAVDSIFSSLGRRSLLHQL